MFTGIVQALGVLQTRERKGTGFQIRVQAPFERIELGESIAVNGVCLTVSEGLPTGFAADVSPETHDKTTLGRVELGAQVHLERALAVGDRLGGHFVSGHVDAVCQVAEVTTVGTAKRVVVRAPGALLHLLAPKGSVCLDGVSLTINGLRGNQIELMLIPHTLQATTFLNLRPGRELNLEVDLLARYVERCLKART